MRVINSDPLFKHPEAKCLVIEKRDVELTNEQIAKLCEEENATFTDEVDGELTYVFLLEILDDEVQEAYGENEFHAYLNRRREDSLIWVGTTQ